MKIINEKEDYQKAMFFILGKVWCKRTTNTNDIPCSRVNPDSFNNFLNDKVNNIWKSLDEDEKNRHIAIEKLYVYETEFGQLTPEQVKKTYIQSNI